MPKMFVVGRSEHGNLPRPVAMEAEGPIPPAYSVSLQSRERAGFAPLVLMVSREEWVDMALGTEVDVILRPVRS